MYLFVIINIYLLKMIMMMQTFYTFYFVIILVEFSTILRFICSTIPFKFHHFLMFVSALRRVLDLRNKMIYNLKRHLRLFSTLTIESHKIRIFFKVGKLITVPLPALDYSFETSRDRLSSSSLKVIAKIMIAFI